jgi:hypothetical protein
MERTCEVKRYGVTTECSDEGPVWDVVYRNKAGKELSRHPACFRHGLAEQDRHYRAGGIAACDVEKPVG